MRNRRSVWLAVLVVVFTLAVSSRVRAARAQPTTATARQVRAAAALAWLHTQQQEDGSFGTAWGVTADAVYVIGRYVQAYGVPEEAPDSPRWTRNGRSALDALAAQTPAIVASGDGGQIAKVLRAVVAAGKDPRQFAGYDLVAALQAAYDPDTGRYHPTNNFRHALAVEALALAGEPVPDAAIRALFTEQRSNGGWGWPYGGTAVDVDTTGLALEALDLAGVPDDDPRIRAAVAYLQTTQDAGGGWAFHPDYPPNCNSTAYALRGLIASGEDPTRPPYTARNPDGTWRNAPAALLSFQDADGGFRWTARAAGTRVLSTSDALIALSIPWPGDHPLSRSLYLAHVVR